MVDVHSQPFRIVRILSFQDKSIPAISPGRYTHKLFGVIQLNLVYVRSVAPSWSSCTKLKDFLSDIFILTAKHQKCKDISEKCQMNH